MKDQKKIKEIVKKHYGRIASSGGCGCGGGNANEISKSIGYSDNDLKLSDANLGLGCGNPTALANIKKGDTVLDLGSGAGFDCFLSAKRVGESGRVIGVDFSKEMIAKARKNVKKYGYKNVEFKFGDIEELPVEDKSIDVVISNCVINLAPSKEKVFNEIARVLKPGGLAYVSDIVLLKELPARQKADETLLSGCVAGALLKNNYINIAKDVGLKVKILSEDVDISKRQYSGIALESLKIEIRNS